MDTLIFRSTEYLNINKEYILSSEGILPFDVYTALSSETQKKPVLLVGKNHLLNDIKQVIADKNFSSLLIKKSDHIDFLRFAESNQGNIIENFNIPLEEKSNLLYECAKNTVKEVFQRPRLEKNIQRTINIADKIIKFILHDNQAVLSLLNLGSTHYYTFSHCVNVTTFALGMWLMIDKGTEEELYDFALGCLLHDIGKTQIDDHILSKTQILTRWELEEVRRHPQLGYELMADHLPEISLDIILHHHEKYTGDGYPDGLKGGEISDHAKIVAIADVFDALTSNRPYGSANAPYKALLMMKEEMVGHFEQDKFLQFINFLGGKKDR